MAQIRQVVSETLQATIRRLLPSQRGFTEDLQASNVIFPVIDLTPSAEGSSLPVDLSRALAFGSQTAFDVANTTSTIVNTAGFHRVTGAVSLGIDNSAVNDGSFSLSDGLSTKQIYEFSTVTFSSAEANFAFNLFDFNIFLDSGESLSATAGDGCIIAGSVRQIADISGNLVNPSGFSAS